MDAMRHIISLVHYQNQERVHLDFPVVLDLERAIRKKTHILVWCLLIHRVDCLPMYLLTLKKILELDRGAISDLTELQIRDFGLLFNHFVPYSYDLSQFEYFYKVQRYPCHHLKHKICQSSLLF